MIDQNFILLIFNCEKYRYKSIKQKETWIKDLPSEIIYFHVIGNLLLENEYEIDETNRILYIKVEDDYNSLPKKVIKSYQIISQLYNFIYIFKTDDDQILIKPNFFDTIINLISNKTPTLHYGGYIVDVPFSYLSQYCKVHPELPIYLPVLKTRYCNGRITHSQKKNRIT
jgi:hypothetical protein